MIPPHFSKLRRSRLHQSRSASFFCSSHLNHQQLHTPILHQEHQVRVGHTAGQDSCSSAHYQLLETGGWRAEGRVGVSQDTTCV